MGDYNVNTLIEQKSSTTQMQEFTNLFSTYYYHKLINLPTRERKQCSTLLDNVYTNIPDCYETGTSGVLSFLTQSDHHPIFTIRNVVTPDDPVKLLTTRIHNEQNIAKHKKHLKHMNWGALGLYKTEHFSTAFSIFIDTMLDNYKICFPIQTFKDRKSVV